MKNRLQQKLKDMRETPDLVARLTELLSRTPTEEELQRGRTLYAIFLRDPEALQIKTIHSFCKDFLMGLFGKIDVLDSWESSKILKIAQSLDDTSGVANDYSYLLSIMTFDQIDETLSALLSRRYEFAEFLKTYDSETYDAFLKKILDSKPSFFDPKETGQIAEEMVKSYQDNQTLKLLLAKDYETAFLTTTQTLRKKLVGLHKSELYPALYAQAECFWKAFEQQKVEELIKKTQAFVRIANVIFQKYQQLKEERDQYDFEDLIMKTNEIFTNAHENINLKSAIRQKIRHLFIDEAQDTTPQQWEIVLHLVSLFFEKGCTLFIVGDIKQSIFSFQGAQPWLFQTLQDVFEKLITKFGGAFERVQLTTSYRSAPAILKLVDTIFADRIREYASHIPVRTEPGIVKCITIPKKQDEQDAEGLTINSTIASLITDLLRNYAPEDILVLSRRRKDLASLSETLSARNIPCELQHARNLMWMDAVALVTFLVDPEDDYNLACLLKSPFLHDFVVSEEQLFYLCYNRKGSLWAVMSGDEEVYCGNVPKDEVDRINSSMSAVKANIRHILSKYRTDAANIRTSDDFYAFFYGRTPTVFLDSVSTFLSENPPVMPVFRNFIQNIYPQGEGNGVRLKTVHGAKGSQSPVVILIDKDALSKDKWVWLEDKGMLLMPTHDCVIRQKALSLRDKEEDRLLYVAITRACDAFISVGNGTWSDMIQDALQ
jgi:ATP-dependent helicase/nuclease subunit A